MSMPMRSRLAVGTAAVMVPVVGTLGLLLVLQIRSDLRNEVEDDLRTTTTGILDGFADDRRDPEEDDQEPGDLQKDLAVMAAAGLPATGVAQVLDSDGRVLARFGSTTDPADVVPRDRREEALASGGSTYVVRIDRDDHRVRLTRFRDPDGPRLLAVGLSLRSADDSVQRAVALALLAGVLAVGVGAAAAYWIAARALRPVEGMASDADEIGTDRISERIAVPRTRDEIEHLAQTLNSMLERIESGIATKHRLVADASHALRSPLAVMRAELDVSLREEDLDPSAREVLESVRDEVDRMSRTVDNLQALAQADEGRLQLLIGPVDLDEAAADACRTLRTLALTKYLTLVVDGEPAQTDADRERMNLALSNLVENAIKFSPPGGTVRVTTWTGKGEVGVTVTDQGPGIPDAERGLLFDRYYRAGQPQGSRTDGSGLGLAISREVARAHGGRLWVDSEIGKGSAFSLSLPARRDLLPAHVTRGSEPPPEDRQTDLH
jgi:signal transduction histidine kinase